MHNVVLAIHLILALLLIGVVLLQRSEGGGLGMGSGGGGVISGRAAATALSKVTWVFAGLFIVTSVTLTILAAADSASTSVVDQVGTVEPAQDQAPAEAPALPDASALKALPATDAPAEPPKAGD